MPAAAASSGVQVDTRDGVDPPGGATKGRLAGARTCAPALLEGPGSDSCRRGRPTATLGRLSAWVLYAHSACSVSACGEYLGSSGGLQAAAETEKLTGDANEVQDRRGRLPWAAVEGEKCAGGRGLLPAGSLPSRFSTPATITGWSSRRVHRDGFRMPSATFEVHPAFPPTA